jgi:hypothetical protein
MRTRIPIVFLVAAFLSALLAPHAEAVPPVPATGLEVQITESGQISLSADGVGSNDSDGAAVQVEKPNAAATVRSAFFSCASNGNRVIGDQSDLHHHRDEQRSERCHGRDRHGSPAGQCFLRIRADRELQRDAHS